MHAERVWLRTDEHGQLVDAPLLPASSEFEAILLLSEKVREKRTVPPELAAMTRIHGDLVAPAVDAEEWRDSK